MRRELGRERALRRLQFGIGIGAGHAMKRLRGAVEQRTALLEREQGVFKGRRGGIVRNGAHFGELLRHSRFDGWLIILVLDPIERWRMKGQRARRIERTVRPEPGLGLRCPLGGRTHRAQCRSRRQQRQKILSHVEAPVCIPIARACRSCLPS